MTLSTFLRGATKNSLFVFYGHFHGLLHTVLGFRGHLQGIWRSIHFREEWEKNSSFMRLWPFSWTIAHSFWGCGVIYRVDDT
jgi:hypothetical protein